MKFKTIWPLFCTTWHAGQAHKLRGQRLHLDRDDHNNSKRKLMSSMMTMMSQTDPCLSNEFNDCDLDMTTCTTTSTNDDGYICSCRPGYKTLTSASCEDIDECAEDNLNDCDVTGPNPSTTCVNYPGGYICVCRDGFENLISETILATGVTKEFCTDIDECAQNNLNECDDNAACTNNAGGYFCTCNNGYQGNGFTCSDINECSGNNLNDCDSDAICTNTAGGYFCTCNDGYQGDGFTCSDINECAGGNLNGCDEKATCNNTPGGYFCTCNGGYEGDGFTCNDIDECDRSTDDCHEHATCSNTEGGFTCECRAGYEGDGFTCNDINECSTNTNVCSSNAICFNTAGGFICECNYGYEGDGFTCNDIDECSTNPDACSNPNTLCVNTEGGFNCECKEGFSGDGITCSVDEFTISLTESDSRGNTIVTACMVWQHDMAGVVSWHDQLVVSSNCIDNPWSMWTFSNKHICSDERPDWCLQCGHGEGGICVENRWIRPYPRASWSLQEFEFRTDANGNSCLFVVGTNLVLVNQGVEIDVDHDRVIVLPYNDVDPARCDWSFFNDNSQNIPGIP